MIENIEVPAEAVDPFHEPIMALPSSPAEFEITSLEFASVCQCPH